MERVLLSDSTNKKLYTVTHASQNNKLKFIQEAFCVYGYTNTHICVYIYMHGVYVFVCILLILYLKKYKH